MQRHHWFIGDIHGCFDALRRLEDAIRPISAAHDGAPHFVSVGDLVDRGPDSATVVGHFRVGQQAGTHSAILGNHEEMLLRCLYDARPDLFDAPAPSRWVVVGALRREVSPCRRGWLDAEQEVLLARLMWLAQGGAPALQSWGLDPRRPETWSLPPDDLAFLRELPVVFRCDAAVATHALVDAADLQALEQAGEMDATLRDLVGRALWRRSLPNGPPDPTPHVSGHTPLRRVRRYASRRLIRVDTGCFLGRRLSAWCPELDRSVSVTGQDALALR